MAEQHDETHGEYEHTSSSAFTGEAAEKLAAAEKQAAEQPERPEEEDEDG